ncbi:MAG: F0F1 ATP synthase subunit A [Kiritimatiellae bacterium]|nr:F0F1 ATP synthase subunit A [Kiritimatiellia bacterium]
MQEKLSAFLEYVNHHVMHHGGSLDALTHKTILDDLKILGHDILAVFHFDETMIILVALLLGALAWFGRKKIGLIPHGLGVILEKYVLFIRDDIVYPNFGGAAYGRRFVPFFCSIFLFILLSNFLGLIPLFTCATGNVNITAALATIFLGVSLWGTLRQGGAHALVHALLPAGLPGPMKPVMFLMEIISLFSRTFALTMRLFANMLGGHVVLYAMVSLTAIFGAVAAPSLAVAICLYLFEVFVAFLQAYVFTMLSAIFIGMMVHPQH